MTFWDGFVCGAIVAALIIIGVDRLLFWFVS